MSLCVCVHLVVLQKHRLHNFISPQKGRRRQQNTHTQFDEKQLQVVTFGDNQRV